MRKLQLTVNYVPRTLNVRLDDNGFFGSRNIFATYVTGRAFVRRVTGMMNDFASSSMIIAPRQSDVSRQIELCPFLAVESWLVRNNKCTKLQIYESYDVRYFITVMCRVDCLRVQSWNYFFLILVNFKKSSAWKCFPVGSCLILAQNLDLSCLQVCKKFPRVFKKKKKLIS